MGIIKTKISQLRAKTIFYLKNKGGKITEVNIPDIPKTWEFFQNTNDLWIKVQYPDDSNLTGCLYKGQKGSVFDGHRHVNSIEQFTILNEIGRVHVYTETWNKEIGYGESVTFQKGEAHFVEFIDDTMISVIWHPKMKGWNAEFINDNV